MKSSLPGISIVTPSYNQGRFLERTILSVLEQRYPDLEYIIMDGASTDNSVQIIRQYAHRLAGWVSEPDAGQADAINKGFRQSTGELLGWLNSDDTLQPGALWRVGALFRDHPDVDVVYGDAYIIDEDDRARSELKDVAFSRRALEYGCVNIQQASTFWRREPFFELGMLDADLQFAMDNDLFLRLAGAGAKFVHIPAALSNYRQHSGAKTQVTRAEVAEENRTVRFRLLGIREGGLKPRVWRTFFKARKLVLLITQGDVSYVFRKAFRA